MKKRAAKKRKSPSIKQPSRSKSKNYKASKKAVETQSRKNWIWTILIAAVFILAIILLVILNSRTTGKVISGYDNSNNVIGTVQFNGQTYPVTKGSWSNYFGINSPLLTSAFEYIFGAPVQTPGVSDVSSAIITIAVWLLIFFTFSDIIATFSSFTKWVAWAVGFLIAVIVANFGWLVVFVAWTTAIFSVLGTVALYVGFGSAFVAFIAVNLGLQGLSKWILRRKAMMLAAKSAAGGERLAGAIRGFGEAGRELEKLGGK